jgi:hypothetical protein
MPITDKGFEYKMPDEIKKKIPKEMLMTFKETLDSVFTDRVNLKGSTYNNYYFYLQETTGWGIAFKESCEKTNSMEIYEYYNSLDWFDSDLFDDEFCLMMVKEGIMDEGEEETEEEINEMLEYENNIL